MLPAVKKGFVVSSLFPHVYLILGVLLLGTTVGVVAPHRYGRSLAALGSIPFIVVMMMTPQIMILGLVLTAVLVAKGGLATSAGIGGLLVHLVAWTLLVKHLVDMQTAHPLLDGRVISDIDEVFEEEAREADLKRQERAPLSISYWPYLRLRTPAMATVQVERSIPYRTVNGTRLLLDIYRPRAAPPEGSPPRPSLVYFHGGAWIIGSRRQSPFMMFELAAAGCVVFAIQYRLAPRSPLPAAIEDCKAAVAWVRAHAAEYGALPDAVVLGGSAGAHLAAMVALSPDEKRFQPGFENADTHVRGAILLYGFYDFVSRLERGAQGKRSNWFFESLIFAARYREKPDVFHAAQPSTHVSSSAPPTLFIHGRNDSLVPIADSRRLHDLLKQAGARSHFVEVPLAQHAFELAPSPLHQRTMRLILRFLETLPS
jgi:acetyl esterase/lipase